MIRSAHRGYVLNILCFLLSMAIGLSNAQVTKWIYSHDGPATAFSVVYGGNNVYAAGYLEATNGNDFAVVGIDTLGGEKWITTYNGTANGDDQANCVVYGTDGNIYAAGKINNTATANDFTIVSLNSSGGENWLYSTDGGAAEGDAATAVVYGLDGCIYAAGNANLTAGNQNSVIVKLTAAGAFRWAYSYNGSATNSTDNAFDLVYGPDGNIYAAGFSTETGTNKDFLVVSVDTAGHQRWTYKLNGTSSNVDQAQAIVYGDDGYVYAAGWTKNATDDITIVKLSTSGSEQWVFTSDTTGTDRAYDLIYGPDNKLYAAGYMKGNQNDYAVMCVDTSGMKSWSYRRNGSSSMQIPNDQANAICTGADGNIYATGYLQNEGSSQDILVPNLGSDGTVKWEFVFNNTPSNANDQGNAIYWGSDNRLYIGGRLGGGNGRFGVICLDPTPKPVIWVWPSFFMVLVQAGSNATRTLKIANTGVPGTSLDWTISERPPVDWLSEDSTSGSLGSSDTTLVTITFDATSVAPGEYYDTLEITSNDPENPSKDISVKLTVPPTGIEENQDLDPADRCEVNTLLFGNCVSLRFTAPSDQPLKISLYDVLGSRVYDKRLKYTPSQVELGDGGIDQLSPGIYFLWVEHPDKKYPIRKLVKL